MYSPQAAEIINLLEKILKRLPEPEPKPEPLTGEAALPRWVKTKPISRFDF